MPDYFRSKYTNRNYKKAIQILGGNICNFSKLHIEIVKRNQVKVVLSILKIVNFNGGVLFFWFLEVTKWVFQIGEKHFTL